MSRQEESIISDNIKNYLNKNRIFNKRNHATGVQSGLPDREFLYKGVLVGIEIKTPKGGEPRGNQLQKLSQYNLNGGIGVKVTSLEDVKNIVKFIDNYRQNENYIINYNKEIKEMEKNKKC